MADEIDEIRRRIDIVDLVSSRVQLKRAGRNFVGLCPFHQDKRPSFNVSPLIGRYKCWSCGAAGDIFNWVMETQKVDFGEALRLLAAQAGVELKRGPGEKKPDQGLADAMADALGFFVASMDRDKPAQDYADGRGLTAEVRAKWGIGYAPEVGDALARFLMSKGHSLNACQDVFLVTKDAGGGFYDRFRGRLMVPIRDERGRLVAFGGRAVAPATTPKYVNSSDTPLFHKSQVLFGMDQAKESIAKQRETVVVEGYLDVVACHQAGVTNAVASLGTSLTENHVKLLKRWCDRVVLFYDGDRAGQNAAERALDMLEPAGLMTRVVKVPVGDDPDSLLRTHGAAAVVSAVLGSLAALDYRVWLLRQRHRPDEAGYWESVAEALARAPNELEFLRLAPEFAAEFPGSRDKEGAIRALKEMAVKAKRGQKVGAPEPDRKETRIGNRSAELVGEETTVFHALADPRWHDRARSVLLDGRLLQTRDGAALAELARAALEESNDPDPRVWLPAVAEEWARLTLSDLLTSAGIVTGEALDDAVGRLEARVARRESKALAETAKDDDDLRKLTASFKSLKGEEKKL